jgi:hypothetical protein
MSRQCRGYTNSLPIVAPYITGLSTTSSMIGTTTVVTIFGENFRNYSTVYFGTTLISNVNYFSSGQLSFYVPAVATVGAYPIQVFNDTLASNIVFFTVDNSVGFWNQDPITGAITNNNSSGGISVTGPLTVNSSIVLNYQPSLITNNTQLGYIITPPTQAITTASNSYSIIVNNYVVPQGVWLLTGTTGVSCNGMGETIYGSVLNIKKDGTILYLVANSNTGFNTSITFSTPFVSDGTNLLSIAVSVTTSGGGAFTPYSSGTSNIAYLTRIA